MPGDFSTLTKPYTDEMLRETSPLNTIGEGFGISETGGGQASALGVAGITEATEPLKSGDGGIANERVSEETQNSWLDGWIKSRNFAPRTRGFYFDGREGTTEIADLVIGRRGIRIYQPETGVNSSNAIYIENSANYPAIDIRKSGTGSGHYIRTEVGAGFSLDVLQKSDTPGIHVRTNNATNAFQLPGQFQNDIAVSTNFYKIFNHRGGTVPAVSLKQWAANNADPNGVVTGEAGDTMQSSNGRFYVNLNASTRWLDIVGSLLRTTYSTCFETAGRFTNTNDGTATNTFGVNGLALTTTANANGWAKTVWDLGSIAASVFLAYKGNPVFTAGFYVSTFGFDDQQMFIGVGNITSASGAAGITFTNNHFGFKVLRESGTVNLYTTNADGVTEKATLLAAIAAADFIEVIAIMTSDASVDYFYRRNGGALSAITTHTLNIPAASTSESVCAFTINNHNVAQSLTFTGTTMSYRR